MNTLDSSSLTHGAEVPGTALPSGLEEAALERQEMPAVHEPADSAALAGEALQPAAECAMAGAPDEQPAADPAASDNLQPSAGEPPAAGAEPVAESTPSVAVLDNYVAPAVSAAKAAADFVAQIFAEVRASDVPEGAAAPVVNDLPVAEAQPAELEPQGRPGEDMAPMQGQNVLVLGLGASGLAMARWCVRCGAQVTVADTREAPPQLALLQQELPQVRFVAGPFDASLVDGKGLHAVYRSPGLSPATFAPVFQAAQAIGLVTGSELTLYAAALAYLRSQHGYAPCVLAITGTNGKTTVTSLTGQLVERAGKPVAVAGNIGPTLLDTLAGHIDADTLPQAWVLELSSFQLDGVAGFEPTAATVLNITQDHLDWHGDINAYAAAKARIFGQTGLMVLNREDPEVMQMLPPPVRVKLQKPQQREHVTFGADMPRRPGDFGIEIVNGMPWLVRALEADETRKRSRSEAEEELHIQRLMPADALRIRGRHNATNALAALALASAAGCPLAPMLYGLR